MPEALPPHWAFKLVIFFLGLLDKLRDLLTPAPVRAMEKGFEFVGSSTIFACCKLKIPDALRPGWNSLPHLASKTGIFHIYDTHHSSAAFFGLIGSDDQQAYSCWSCSH